MRNSAYLPNGSLGGYEFAPVIATSVFGVLYSTVFLSGFIGNSVVLAIILKDSKWRGRSSTNLFIANLAFADILICSLAMPFTCIEMLMGEWVFGVAMCKITSGVMTISVSAATSFCLVISVDRFLYVLSNSNFEKDYYSVFMKYRYSLVAGLWVLSVLFCVPVLMFQSVTKTMRCSDEKWPSVVSIRVFTITCFAVQYLVPLFIMCYCYGRLFVVSKKSIDLRIDQLNARRSSLTPYSMNVIQKRTKKNRVLLLLAGSFMLSWLPFHIVNIAQEFTDNGFFQNRYTFLSVHLLAMMSVIYNPILYGWANKNLRDSIKRVTVQWKRRLSTAASAVSATEAREQELTRLTKTPEFRRRPSFTQESLILMSKRQRNTPQVSRKHDRRFSVF